MAEEVGNSDTENSIVDMQIIECDDNDENEYSCGVPTQNRFVNKRSGRGSKQARRSSRKQVSATYNTDTVDKKTLIRLSQDDRFMCMYDILTKNNEVLNEMKREQSRHFHATEELQASVTQLSERVDRIERSGEFQNECLKTLTYRSIDLEARSRRNNLILYGITERQTLNVVQLVLNFIEDELDLSTDGIVIERAHRLGPRINHDRRVEDPKRPIIVRLRDYMDTELIMKRGYKLKGTPFGIDRDYPKEIATARKQLYSSQEAREARIARKKVQILYPAKLIIEGQLIRDSFPEWHRYMRKDRMEGIQSINSAHMQQIGASNHIQSNSREKIYSSDSDNCSNESESESIISLSTKKEAQSSKKQSDGPAHQHSTYVKTIVSKDSPVNQSGGRNTRGRQSDRKDSKNKNVCLVSDNAPTSGHSQKSQSEAVRNNKTENGERQRGKSKNRTGESKSTNESSTVGNTANSTGL